MKKTKLVGRRFYLSKKQNHLITHAAKVSGLTVSEILRRIIDNFFKEKH